MTIEHLRYFLAAAKYLNMSKAADSLYIHQSTLSRCIAGMEEELGAKLFISENPDLCGALGAALFALHGD